MSPVQRIDRRELINGLRALAALLDTNPQVPVPRYSDTTMSIYTRYETGATNDGEAIAEVHRIAALLGTTVTVNDGHHFTRVSFGPVGYEARMITRERMTLHAARTSYCDVISLDGDEGA
ncbi:hypothetical protein [Nonomuraea typhae]|uniref:hypothetical protein n=1 Tax=Nonomuraea typhae TaxID=2603600 RepID=UPI0012FCDE04|nr:hypothetical protein [Nonomuraea typhae]